MKPMTTKEGKIVHIIATGVVGGRLRWECSCRCAGTVPIDRDVRVASDRHIPATGIRVDSPHPIQQKKESVNE